MPLRLPRRKPSRPETAQSRRGAAETGTLEINVKVGGYSECGPGVKSKFLEFHEGMPPDFGEDREDASSFFPERANSEKLITISYL